MSDLAALSERIDRLEAKAQEYQDILDIQALKVRYAEACDLGYNADEMMALFTPDGVWEFTNEWGTHRGHKEIHAFMVSVAKQIKWALHFMIGPKITIESATRATGTWYILELATMVGLNDPAQRDAVVLSGRYEDVYEKTDGSWKFKHVKVNIGQCSNLDEGWVKQPLRG